jgi:hypothetical protein
MTSAHDLFCTAKRIVNQHGDDAPTHAAMRADELMAKGGRDGQVARKRVLKAVDKLPAKERPRRTQGITEPVWGAQ